MAGSTARVDPRGLRFAATLTAIVLAAVLLTSNGYVLAAQGVVFAIGAIGGMRRAPYGLLFRYTLAKRLGPPAQREPEAPPRFAQAVGLVRRDLAQDAAHDLSRSGFGQAGRELDDIGCGDRADFLAHPSDEFLA